MLISIIILILLAAVVTGLVLYPKSGERENGMTAVVNAVMLSCCFVVLGVWISDRLIGRVHPAAVMALLLIPAAVLWGGIWRRRAAARFFWKAADVAGMTAVLLFACGTAGHVFTSALKPQYGSSVGAEQYLAAMRLLQYGSGRGEISFSAGMEAFFIGVSAPFLGETQSVQAFIAAEIFLRLLEAGVFYAAVLAVSSKKTVRYAAPVLGICYFFGYPSLSLLWANYDYWNTGALLFLYGFFVLTAAGKKQAEGGFWILRVLGCAAVCVCCGGQYAACFAPALLFAATGLWAVRRRAGSDASADGGKTVPEKTFWGVTAILLLCDLLAVVWFFRTFFTALDGVSAGYDKTTGIYRCMYGDLLFFIPVLVFVAVYACYYIGRNRVGKIWTLHNADCVSEKEAVVAAGITGVILTAAVIILYTRWYGFALDTYYYFLNYYILWAAGWILVAAALALMAETKQLSMFFSYSGMIAAIGVLTLTNYDFKMWHHNIDYNQPGVTKNFFPLYRQSMDGLLADYGAYRLPEGFLEAMASAAKADGITRPAIVTADEAMQYWNDGLQGAASDGYRLDKNEFPDVIRALEEDQVNGITVAKTEDSYGCFAEYYQYCRVLYENETAVVFARPEGGWAENEAMAEDYSAAKRELFSYAAEHYAAGTVPLMADRSAYIDYIMYENLTGTKSSDFYTWHFMPVDNLKNLNERGIKTIVLLNGDEYYESTKDYLDRQTVVFENEAGRVLTCSGTQWATQY